MVPAMAPTSHFLLNLHSILCSLTVGLSAGDVDRRLAQVRELSAGSQLRYSLEVAFRVPLHVQPGAPFVAPSVKCEDMKSLKRSLTKLISRYGQPCT